MDKGYQAIRKGDIEELKQILEHGQLTDFCKSRLLWHAVQMNKRSVFNSMRLLVEAGANLNYINLLESGKTVLMLAVYRQNMECVEYLLEHGADIDEEDHKWNTALIYAIGRNNNHCIELLLKHKADVNKGCKGDRTPLIHAVKRKNLIAVQMLIEHGACVRGNNVPRYRPLFHAIYTENTEIINLLINAGADVNPTLMAALGPWKINLNRLEMILDAGANVDFQCYCYGTPLMRAALILDVAAFKYLLKRKANVNYQNHRGQTALMVVARSYPETSAKYCIEALLNAGADINLTNNNGQNILFYAAYTYRRRVNAELVRFFLNLDVQIPWKRRREYLPLSMFDHLVEAVNDEVELLLFASGVELDSRFPIPDCIQPYIGEKSKPCLKNLCRVAIREHIKSLNPNRNLFMLIPRLHGEIPNALVLYLLYDMTLDSASNNSSNNE